jgi:hypothetical protein
MPATTRPPLSPSAELAQRFRHFAEVECPEEPLYQALCRIVAADPSLLLMLEAAPPQQQRPNLWLAAVHDRLLEGGAHPLAEYFASCGGERAPDAALAGTLEDFVAHESTELEETIRTRSTQTNETGRCAVLWPALQEIARRAGPRPLALLDVGCSAGLNLGVDRYRYDYGDFALGAPQGPGVPLIACRLKGPGRPDASAAPPRIAERLGIDPFPIDVQDAREVRWLQACVWPGDKVRALRLQQAVAIARGARWPVRREADCTGALAAWLEGLQGDVQPVILNTWVLAYFDPAALQRHADAVTALVRSRGAMWLSGEIPSLRIGPPQTLPPSAGDKAAGMLWTLCSRIEGEPVFEPLARSHGHGRWMQWLGGAQAGQG